MAEYSAAKYLSHLLQVLLLQGQLTCIRAYCPNTTVEILNLDDSLQIATDNLTAISKTIPRPGFVFVINWYPSHHRI
ncbi:hypothetical protein [Treponema phagedenis]|uniref:Uncharacterized protein n=1 Tax=Treponema phagedenis TaxID=162 RepID=A0A0B7GVU2_TREPH|nr:hypothetical protein [Treponema phagedenis]CEM61065.1 hypothetical protein TPHV1_140013 [Treponema phagedenis]